MNVPLGKTVTIDFTTHNPVTGAVQDTDIPPTCDIFQGDTDVPVLSPAPVRRGVLTGNYRVTFAVTVANGFQLSRIYNLIATAQVNLITAKARIEIIEIESSLIAFTV